jgi:hypothetical protein
MNKPATFPFLDHLLELKEGEETIIFVGGRAFLISPATEDDIERISKGYFCMD